MIECKAIIQSWGSADVTVHETTAQRVLSFFILKAILVLRRGAIGSRHTPVLIEWFSKEKISWGCNLLGQGLLCPQVGSERNQPASGS